jgi:predicted nucleic acid-binding protein
VALVVDASVGLKWVLEEPGSRLAQALVEREPNLMVPDFWLNEATNVLWLRVRRGLLTAEAAREGLALLRALLEPTPTAELALHEVALDIGMAVNLSTYDTLYVAFAIAMEADAVVAADGPFVKAIQSHADPELAAKVVSLEEWARSRGVDVR